MLGLLLHRLALTALFAAGAKNKQGRATHKTGVGARGTLAVRDTLELPEHDLWQPGRRFDLLLRHANLNEEDDLSADYRGAALRLIDPGSGAAVLDILMNTGATTVWCHVAMFAERMRLMLRKQLPKFYERHPDALDRYWGGLRRAPDSYEGLAYYSKLTGKYVDRSGKTWGCRYRMIPPEPWDGVETGLPTQRDRDAGVLATERWPEETRPKDTLRKAYHARVAEGPIRYRLQIAVREVSDDYRDQAFDPCRAWDEATHPWRELAELSIDAPLPDAKTESLAFNIANAPASLGLFPARSAKDHTSIAWLRATLYTKAAAKRPR